MKRKEVKFLIIYADGGCKRNGKANPQAYGTFVVIAVKADGSHVKVKQATEQFPNLKTNNQSEYQALINALSYVSELIDKSFTFPTTIVMDSELVVKQTNGEMKVKAPGLVELNNKAKSLLKKTGAVLEYREREYVAPMIGH